MSKKRLFNLPDAAVQQWKPFHLDEKEYVFNHLDAVKHTFNHPERQESYTLFFTFSHHTFTRSPTVSDAKVRACEYYQYPSDLRIFDITRYELSKQLPEIIKNLPEQFLFHGGYGRYCSVKIQDRSGEEVNYQIVYRVWKERGKMRFHIESAYPIEPMSKVKKVNFWSICHNLLRGKKLPEPANRK
ncbi:heat-shock protein [Vibrio quintilis]|uniref:Heat shock protein C n=1 Tax=Vibrio quintilis TaxID=1117707 RepID=A0A1M7YZ61_9VIBR|nr:heat-shock protein [Vibrio quintilis]SHO57874.1 Heat shock protein C [Vibrio quintilis]